MATRYVCDMHIICSEPEIIGSGRHIIIIYSSYIYARAAKHLMLYIRVYILQDARSLHHDVGALIVAGDVCSGGGQFSGSDVTKFLSDAINHRIRTTIPRVRLLYNFGGTVAQKWLL